MKLSSKLIGSTMLGALCLLAPATASAGTKFHIKNCSNHTVSVDIALADWFKPSVKSLKGHKTITLDCMSSKCNIGVTWGGHDDMGTTFEHLYKDKTHGDYVFYMTTGKSGQSVPSLYCTSAFALRKGSSCDIFDKDYKERDELTSLYGNIKKCQ